MSDKSSPVPSGVPLAGMDRHFALLDDAAFEVMEWCPSPDASGRPTQVHLLFHVTEDTTLVVRLKTPEGLRRVVDALNKHGSNVWPADLPPTA